VGDERQGVEGLLARLTAFAESGDLARVGGLRYVYARATDEGTHFLVFHTDESLNIYEMFPQTGDAPGRDVPGLPRPEGARRFMSAWEEGDPHAITMYATTRQSADELRGWYREALPGAGWTLYEPTEAQLERFTQHWSEADRRGVRDARALHAEHGDQHVMVVLADDRGSGQAVATLLTSR
jgi:hypothetical protein